MFVKSLKLQCYCLLTITLITNAPGYPPLARLDRRSAGSNSPEVVKKSVQDTKKKHIISNQCFLQS